MEETKQTHLKTEDYDQTRRPPCATCVVKYRTGVVIVVITDSVFYNNKSPQPTSYRNRCRRPDKSDGNPVDAKSSKLDSAVQPGNVRNHLIKVVIVCAQHSPRISMKRLLPSE
jgi:hypothetical protein